MSNPFQAESHAMQASPRVVPNVVDYDDDDEDADCDDDDEGISASPYQAWFSNSGFGSPEWWSRR